MGRPPIGKKAMTPAERQVRRRKRLKKQLVGTARKVEKQRSLLKNTERYIPTPPGITYYERMAVKTADGEGTVWVPKTRPAAAMTYGSLDDEDILAVLRGLFGEAFKRKLDVSAFQSESPPMACEGGVSVYGDPM